MTETLGQLTLEPALERPDLLAPPVAAAIAALQPEDAAAIGVTEIDPDLADTAAMTEAYGLSLDISANCVVIAGKRAGEERYAACVILATTRADVNNVARKRLDVRKASFASTEYATEASGMEYGGITPVGIPGEWALLVDSRVVVAGRVVVGSGVRRSKLVLPGSTLAELPGAEVIEDLGRAL